MYFFHWLSSLFHFPLYLLLKWVLTPFHAEMAEIIFLVLSHLNVMSGYPPQVGLKARWTIMKKIWSLINRSITRDVLSIHCAGLLRLKFCWPCFLLLRPSICSFAASSARIRHKVFGAGCRFQLEITDVSYNKRHLRHFRIIYVDYIT